MKPILVVPLILFLFIILPTSSASTSISGSFGIDNPSLPHLTPQAQIGITNNNITINNYTTIINNITQPMNYTYLALTNQTNVFQDSQYVTEGKVIGFRGNAQAPDNDSYFFYNATSNRLALYVNGRLQQDWGNSTTVYGTATFQEGLQGGQTNESGNTYNISAGNFIGYLDWRYLLNVPKALNITVDQALKLADSGDGNTTVVAVEQIPGAITFYTNTTLRMIIYPNGTTQFFGPIIGDGSGLTNLSTFNATYNMWAYNQTIAAIEFITNYTYNRSEIDSLITYYTNTSNFYTRNESDARFRNVNDLIPTNEVNKTTGTSYLGQLLDAIIDAITGRLSSLEQDKLNATDQRYNDTQLINNVNTSLSGRIDGKLDTTDQRYNDTGYVDNKLTNYYNKSETYSKSEVYNKSEVDSMLNGTIGNIGHLNDTLNNFSKWAYNQTTAANTYTDYVISIYNDSWSSTYNATYAVYAYNQTGAANAYTDYIVTVYNDTWSSTYNATYAGYAPYIYNYTQATYDLYNAVWSSTYNATYAQYAYNQTDAANTYTDYLISVYNSSWLSTYNVTYDSALMWAYNQTAPAISYIDSIISQNNASWLSTFNATYEQYAYNQTLAANSYTDSVISTNNASWTSTYNVTYANALIYAYNHTQISIDYIISYAYNKSEIYNKTEVDSLLNDKLNTTDQRYNDTGYVDGIVSTNNASWTSTYNATYDLWAYNQTSNTKSKGAQPWLSNDSDTIYFNETYYNQTTRSLAKVNAWTSTSTLTTSGGNGANKTTTILGFLITEIGVYPTSNATQYKFKLVESASGAVIDQDRATHTGVWRIEKNYALNDSANITITNSNPDSAYTIQIKYVDNFRP